MPETDILPDLVAPGLRLLICGSRPGTVSAQRGAYYAGPQNRFWPVLHQIGVTPRQLRPEEYPTLLGWGIGLTDIAKTSFGPDILIRRGEDDRARLGALLRRFTPRILAFNGKRAAAAFLGGPSSRLAFGLQPEPVDATALFVLPSTSRAANRYWDATHWQALAQYLATLPESAAGRPGNDSKI